MLAHGERRSRPGSTGDRMGRLVTPLVGGLALMVASAPAGLGQSPSSAGAQPAAAAGSCTIDVTPGQMLVGERFFVSADGLAPETHPSITMDGPGETFTFDLSELPGPRYMTDLQGHFGPLDFGWSTPEADQDIAAFAGPMEVTITDGACEATTTVTFEDSMTWQPVEALAGDEGSMTLLSVAVAPSGRMVVVGGRGDAAAPGDAGDATVWWSDDGVDWTEVALPGGEAAGSAVGVAANGNGIVAIGHTEGGPGHIWFSTDGADWEVVQAPALTRARLAGLGEVDADASGFVIAGTTVGREPARGGGSNPRPVPFATAWTSSDGQTWTVRRVSSQPGIGSLAAVGLGTTLVAGQTHGDEGRPRLWASSDGSERWQGARLPQGAGRPTGLTALQMSTSMLLAGPSGLWQSPSDPIAWSSVDGLSDEPLAVAPFGYSFAALQPGALQVSFDGVTVRPIDAAGTEDLVPLQLVSTTDGRLFALVESSEAGAGTHLWVGTPD
jgi:hypothetical protein